MIHFYSWFSFNVTGMSAGWNMRSKRNAGEPDVLLKWIAAHPVLTAALPSVAFFLIVFVGNHRVSDALLGSALTGLVWVFVGLRCRRLMGLSGKNRPSDGPGP